MSKNAEQLSLEERVRQLEEIASVLELDLPSDVMQRITDGENPIRVIRRHRLMTQRELSELSDLGENHISSIENGKQFNTHTARKLARALNVRIDDNC